MILGIGCDIIESERIERLLTETEKIDRIFTESERKYCDGKGKERSASYAARFAAKEAAAKAFGCSERKYCDGKGKERSASYAARFAAKEAAAKAFGCGIGPVAWTEIETVKETDGAPYFRFYGKAEDLMKKHSGSKMHLSVSHRE